MKKLLENALKVCDSAEVYLRKVSSSSVSMLMGELKNIASEKKTEVSLRIVKEGKMGAAIATSIDDETIIERALISLKHQGADAYEFENINYEAVQCESKEVLDLTTKQMVENLNQLSERIKKIEESLKFGLGIDKEIKEVHLINSAGFEGNYTHTKLDQTLYTLNAQGFYNVDKSYSGTKLNFFTDEDIKSLINMHQLEDKQVSLSNEKMPVVFSGNAMGALMLRVLAGVNAGDVIKAISPVIGKLGTQVFSSKITIRDDGTLPFGINTFAFDDEGTNSQNTLLYEKGILRNYLASQSHAHKLGIPATGNAIKRALFSKEIEDAPAVFETNLIVEGDSIPDEELISNIDRGLFVTGVMGAHTGNINHGDFSLNISSGYLIEKGKFVGKVKGAMIAGNVYALFKEVEAIGTNLEPMTGIFYHMGYSPMVKFRLASIVGK
ncbi:TldD/PmbA family protein [Fusibacter bizertensis]